MATEELTEPEVLPWRRGWGLRPSVTVFIFASLAFLGMGTWAAMTFGSIRQAIGYYLRGETLFVNSNVKTYGMASPGDDVQVSFKLSNRGREAIRVVGCFSICGCMVPKDLPFVIPPSGSRDFNLSIHIPDYEPSQARFTNLDVVVYTSSPGQSRIPLQIKGEIRGKAGTL